jgi:DNA-directed RNA polymerase beta' subunit
VTQKATINNKVVPEGVTRFDTYQNGLPVYGGVADPRMGTFDARARCKTCDCTYTGSGSEKVRCIYRVLHVYEQRDADQSVRATLEWPLQFLLCLRARCSCLGAVELVSSLSHIC